MSGSLEGKLLEKGREALRKLSAAEVYNVTPNDWGKLAAAFRRISERLAILELDEPREPEGMLTQEYLDSKEGAEKIRGSLAFGGSAPLRIEQLAGKLTRHFMRTVVALGDDPKAPRMEKGELLVMLRGSADTQANIDITNGYLVYYTGKKKLYWEMSGIDLFPES